MTNQENKPSILPGLGYFAALTALVTGLGYLFSEVGHHITPFGFGGGIVAGMIGIIIHCNSRGFRANS